MAIEFIKDGHDYKVLDDCGDLIGFINVYTCPPFAKYRVAFDVSNGYECDIDIETFDQIGEKMKELQEVGK